MGLSLGSPSAEDRRKNNKMGENVIITQHDIHEGQVNEEVKLLGNQADVGLERTKKSLLMSSMNVNTVETNAQLHTNGFINRRGIRKGLITSSLFVGAVQRKDVDTVYTCLASNSNMTQASRAVVKLQMNREYMFCFNFVKKLII